MELFHLLGKLRAEDGSDLHLMVGEPPVFRIAGELKRQGEVALDRVALEALVMPLLSEAQQTLLEQNRGLDLSLRHEGQPFRMHIFYDRRHLGAAVRVVPNRVPTLEELELHNTILPKLIQLKRGLILVTGATGSGKSTTTAAMLEEINRTRAERIVTIENPVEYEFQSKLSMITQQNVGEDIPDIPSGLRGTYRMDPDIVWVGELVNLETLHLALAVAESGHLVFTNMMMDTASAAVNRLIEAFPEGQQSAIRRMVARNLQAVVAQKLVPRASGTGRVPVQEYLIGTTRVRQMIVEGYTDFTVAIEAGRDIGMQTMDDALIRLVESGTISRDLAYFHLLDKSRLVPGAE